MSLLIGDPIENMKLLNKKVDVLVSEFNSVLNEMQVTVQGLAGLTTAGLKSLDARLALVENYLKKYGLPADTEPSASVDRSPVEL